MWCPARRRWRTGSGCTSRGGGSATAPCSGRRRWRRCTPPKLRAARTFLFADDITSGTYALGWHRTTFEGHPYLSHGGGIFGFPAYVALLPDIAAGVVVLANADAWFHPHHEITAWVFARLLGGEVRDWHGESMAHKAAIVAQAESTLAAQDSAPRPGNPAHLAP